MFPSIRGKKKSKKMQGRYKRSTIIIISAVSVLILAAAGYLAFFAGKTVTLGAKAVDFTKDSVYTAVNKTIFYLKDSKLYSIDYSGNNKWNADTFTDGTGVCASTSIVAAYNATSVQAFSYSGESLYTKEFYGSVKMVCTSDTLTAVLNEDTLGNQKIILLSRSGEELNRIDCTGKYVLAFGFYQSDSLYVYTVDTASVIPISTITTYSSSLSSTGKVEVDDQLLQQTVFAGQSVYAVGTREIIQMDFLGEQSYTHLIYGWNYNDSYVYTNDKIAFLFVPGGDTAAQSTVHNARICVPGKQDVSVQLPTGTIQVMLGKDKMYAFTPNGVRVYNLDGERQKDYLMPVTAEKIIILPGASSVLAVTGDGVSVVSLP